MSRGRRHTHYGLSTIQIDELIELMAAEIYRNSPKIRRLMSRSDFEELLIKAKPEILDWIKEQKWRYPVVRPAQIKEESKESEYFREQKKFMAEICTGLWRLNRKLVDPENGQPAEITRRAYRHLQSVFDVIKSAGYVIIDHIGKPFDPDLGLHVLVYEPRAGLRQAMIVETIKPTIYFQKGGNPVRIQQGDVIVAHPAE